MLSHAPQVHPSVTAPTLSTSPTTPLPPIGSAALVSLSLIYAYTVRTEIAPAKVCTMALLALFFVDVGCSAASRAPVLRMFYVFSGKVERCPGPRPQHLSPLRSVTGVCQFPRVTLSCVSQRAAAQQPPSPRALRASIAAAGAPHRHPRAVPAPHPLRLCPLESQAAMAAWPSTARRARRAAHCSSASQTCWFPALACIALAAAFTSTSRRLMRFDPAIQVRPGVRRRVTGWRRQRRGDLVSVRQR